MKTLIDYMTEEDLAIYKELEAKAAANKAANPSTFGRKMTTEEKIAATKKKIAAETAKLEALLAAEG